MRDMRPKPEWTRQQNAAPNAAGAVVTEHHRLLLQAALGDGAQAESAFKTWRARVPLDDIEPSAYRVLGHIVDTAIRNRVDDPEMPRIRGVLKHTWITNMRRMRALDKALYSLQCAGIQVMVLKGAALFARYPALCTQLAVGDFDIPVRPADGPRTIDTLMKAGFRPRELLPERFVAADFEKQHALSFEHNTVGGEIDVHWWPLPRWTSQAYVDELFARSELADLEGRRIKIPGLSDHLLLTLARSQLWDHDEIFTRTIETVQILRGCKGRIDWQRVAALATRFHCTTIATAILRLARSELQVSVPDAVMDELARGRSLLDKLDLAIGRRPFAERTPVAHFCQRTIGLVRSDPKLSPSLLGTARDLIAHRTFRDAVRSIAFEELPRFPGRSARRLWRAFISRNEKLATSGVDYVVGFSRPEKTGRWTDGFGAVMTVPIKAEVGSHARIGLTVRPLLTAHRRSFVTEICAGQSLLFRKVFTAADPVPARLTIKAEIVKIAAFRGAVLAFDLPDAVRLTSLGLSEDSRLLGLHVEGIEVVAPALPRIEALAH